MRAFVAIFAAFAAAALLATGAATLALLIALDHARADGGAVLATRQSLVVVVVMTATFALLLILGFLCARRWSAPQSALFEASRAVAQGNYDLSFDEAGHREIQGTMRNLGRVARSFDRLETARRTWLVSAAEELRAPIADVAATLAADVPIARDDLAARMRRLHDLAEDLHAVALADLGRLPVSFDPVDPVALIHNAIWAKSGDAAARGITLDTGTLPAATVLVRWDGARIEQMFGALIENSLRYTPAGGRITLSLEGQRAAWRLIVDDSAPGVDVELAQRLFEPFYRPAAAPGEPILNSGLGLATAQAIVEAHHGRIAAGLSPIGGLRVTVILPAQPPTA